LRAIALLQIKLRSRHLPLAVLGDTVPSVPGTPDGVPVVAVLFSGVTRKIFQKGITIYAGLASRMRLD
jgi:hypothetical protein